MFQNIAVGTDGSERAWRAVARAAQLAAACDATLHVIHAYQGTRESIEAAGKAVIERLGPELAATGARVQPYALQGDPADVMIDWAQHNDVDLIIVGNKGMTGRRGRLLGSIPNAVAHEAPCAVMIVPTQHHGDLFGTVVVGTLLILRIHELAAPTCSLQTGLRVTNASSPFAPSCFRRFEEPWLQALLWFNVAFLALLSLVQAWNWWIGASARGENYAYLKVPRCRLTLPWTQCPAARSTGSKALSPELRVGSLRGSKR